MRESDKLKTVLAIYEQQTKTSIKAELSEVEDHDRCMDQKIRTRTFEARNDRMTGVLVKTKKREECFDRKSGDCCQWKAKGQCTICFRHDESKRGTVTPSSSLAPRPQTK